jgi:methionyl-tRNA formyltransferase
VRWLPNGHGSPGIASIGPKGSLLVRTGGSTAVKILELQPAGKKRMTAEEFLRGYPLKDGDRFGPETAA